MISVGVHNASARRLSTGGHRERFLAFCSEWQLHAIVISNWRVCRIERSFPNWSIIKIDDEL